MGGEGVERTSASRNNFSLCRYEPGVDIVMLLSNLF